MNNNEYLNQSERAGYKRGWQRGVAIGMLLGAIVLAFGAVVCLMFAQPAQPPQNVAQAEPICKMQMTFGKAELHQYTGTIKRAALN